MTNRDDEYTTTRHQAGELNAAIEDIAMALSSMEAASDVSTYPRHYAAALLQESQSTLQAINNEIITHGQRTIVANVLTAIQVLEKAGPQYGEITEKLADMIGDLGERGLVIDGLDLSNGSRRSRIR